MRVRTARSREDLEAVWRLTHDVYVAEGYAAPQADGMLRHYALDGLPETTVWLAEDDAGQLVGTLSLTLDNPVGLHVDEDFKDVVDGVRGECRREGKVLGAFWRIVSDPSFRGRLEVSLGLVNAGVEAAASLPVDVSLYTFNPKHESFYRRVLDLEPIAGPRPSHSVQGAPGILMRGERKKMVARWAGITRRRTSARLAPVAVG